MPNASDSAIQFHFLKAADTLAGRTALKKFLRKLFSLEGKRISTINYIFCSDTYLLEINKKYLRHNYFTDVITFPLSSKAEPILADIYISIDRIRINAREHQATIKQELHRVIFHGALHLCGYGDKTSSQIRAIRGKEDFYLSRYFKTPVPRETKK